MLSSPEVLPSLWSVDGEGPAPEQKPGEVSEELTSSYERKLIEVSVVGAASGSGLGKTRSAQRPRGTLQPPHKKQNAGWCGGCGVVWVRGGVVGVPRGSRGAGEKPCPGQPSTPGFETVRNWGKTRCLWELRMKLTFCRGLGGPSSGRSGRTQLRGARCGSAYLPPLSAPLPARPVCFFVVVWFGALQEMLRALSWLCVPGSGLAVLRGAGGPVRC